MSTHDELAFAAAQEAVAKIRSANPEWSALFSDKCHVTSSRDWPVPDFVINDTGHGALAAAEFKPPGQTKREYLTGLGQAVGYTLSFDYGALIVPEISDDGFRIADFIEGVIVQQHYDDCPLILASYDPAAISPKSASLSVRRLCKPRSAAPSRRATVDNSFYAKWREISPSECAIFLRYLYREQVEPSSKKGTIRDRAWALVWRDIQAGLLTNWNGEVRNFTDTLPSRTGNMKNWRNFIRHIGWVEADGSLTPKGIEAHHQAMLYGGDSKLFERAIARALLLQGKHLILIKEIAEYQNSLYDDPDAFPSEQDWLAGIEKFLEDKGLLQHNLGRAGAATKGAARQFLKAEKQVWFKLGITVPRSVSSSGRARHFHPGQGFRFNWAHITDLVRD